VVTPSSNVVEYRFTAAGPRVLGYTAMAIVVDRPGWLTFEANTTFAAIGGLGFFIAPTLPTYIPAATADSYGPPQAVVPVQSGSYYMIFQVGLFADATVDDWILRVTFTPQ
jgi:hypothetical protein